MCFFKKPKSQFGSELYKTQGQFGNQLKKPAINISKSGMINKGIVLTMGLMCHLIKYRKHKFSRRN